MKAVLSVAMLSIALMAVAGRPIELADPTIFVEDGTYYLYGTSSPSDSGFEVYTSTDLENWQGPAGACGGWALRKGDAYGTRGFWAPQVLKVDTTYYMLYTADEHIAVARSASPLGPFVNDGKCLPSDTRRIDPYLFRDADGKYYLYHVRLDGENKICVSTGDGDYANVLSAEAGTWEDTANADWRVAEGPTVIKHGGRYHLFYSANDFRNPDYAVGHATADSLVGPWRKSGAPVVSRHNTGMNGSGHGDVFIDNNGAMRYVFHVHASDSTVAPRRTAIVTLIARADGTFAADSASVVFPVALQK